LCSKLEQGINYNLLCTDRESHPLYRIAEKKLRAAEMPGELKTAPAAEERN